MNKSVKPNIHILRRNLTNRWVDFKTTPINWMGTSKKVE
jgi:hypothetical protein